MAPMFFVMGLYFSLKDNNRHVALVLSGVFYALAMTVYPPFRVAVPAFLILFCVIRQWEPRRYLVQALSLLVVFSPVLKLTLTGEIQKRFNYLSIYGQDASNPFADENVLVKSWHLFLNIVAHFDPIFLFINGDSNVRHSPSFSGMLSYAIGFVLLLFIARLCLRGIQWFDKTPFLLIAAGLISFTVPAALTWEGIPHSLRSIGAWPFWVLLATACLKQMPRLLPSYLICIIVIVEGTAFHYNYLTKYAEESPDWFDNSRHLDRPMVEFYHQMQREELNEEEIVSHCASTPPPLPRRIRILSGLMEMDLNGDNRVSKDEAPRRLHRRVATMTVLLPVVATSDPGARRARSNTEILTCRARPRFDSFVE